MRETVKSIKSTFLNLPLSKGKSFGKPLIYNIMRKLFISFLGIIMLFGCSSNNPIDTPTVPTTFVFPKSVDIKRNVIVETYNIAYFGNKIDKIVSGSYKQVFTYTGNLITKIDGFDGSNKQYSEEFIYQSNKLKESIYIEYTNNVISSKYKSTYDYITTNAVDVKNYEVNIATGIETYYNTEKRTFFNGNITKLEGGWENSVRSYEYDTNASPFKNVLGFDMLVVSNLILVDYNYINVCANNVIKEVSTGINNNYTLLTTNFYSTNGNLIEAVKSSVNSNAKFNY